MNTVELFCGTKSFSKVMVTHGYSTFTADIRPEFEPDYLGDIRNLKSLPYVPDILWASPPCQGFSVAVIGRNWNRDYTPKTDSARLAIDLVLATLRIIEREKPEYWFIENPRGMLRKMPFMDDFLKEQGGVRHTISYCQYGDTRQKPTDIWTNCLNWKPRPMCKRGATCHEAAPRGSKTGTQGIKGARDRGRIPEALFEEILSSIPKPKQ